jgi:hypothetical protein
LSALAAPTLGARVARSPVARVWVTASVGREVCCEPAHLGPALATREDSHSDRLYTTRHVENKRGSYDTCWQASTWCLGRRQACAEERTARRTRCATPRSAAPPETNKPRSVVRGSGFDLRDWWTPANQTRLRRLLPPTRLRLLRSWGSSNCRIRSERSVSKLVRRPFRRMHLRKPCAQRGFRRSGAGGARRTPICS